ncbi:MULTISPECIES: serine/threonine phosphatase [unclassified Nodularia (in: cyanobacteria)]|uniref:serine/threonine phosphatase n=1 Tax=unclassified Nodularia (in: cyanobacteria) TaxID=2656917 RepID=UPI001881C35A|nr:MULTISPECIES: serine/threonine phosphatase [unclassified Nodularia (in: cyanobacteria)]MBE9199510.1 serine/threonine phosphatase [Nodularia sp. LEGE 06071]MCC2691323.1 serine/threonine phosphatase [Nodularia sp. LEGE 04288]
MLICPQCTFENPNTNKFCQSCGASLTHKVCPECSTEVPVNAQLCHNCGAECGIVWQAIIAKSRTGEESEDTTVTEENQEISPTSTISRLQLSVGSYLDPEQRYQLLEPLSAAEENISQAEILVKVLDCQPYQISPIEAILANQQQGLVVPSLEISEVSRLAKAYIVLQSQSHPGIPAIHDAWQEDDLQVLLIEDRSDWQSLLDLWQSETTSTLQILHCLYQMTQLWAVLETVNCRQSLLELANLRLDEDQTLALQRLYVEPLNEQPSRTSSEEGEVETFTIPEQLLTIQALGQVWQALFRQSQRTQFGSVVQILEDLALGKIQTVEQLRSRLEDIAAELETPMTSTADSMEEKDIATPTILQFDDLDDFSAKADDMPTVVLSMQLSSLEDAGRTDVGRQRHHNEDCFGIETKINKLELPKKQVLQARGLYILCDGMGGHAGGEVASELAVNTVREYFDQHWITKQMPLEAMLREAIYLANQAIYEVNQEEVRSGIKRMGTTLVMLLIQGTQAAAAHVGDSRLYRLTRKRGLEQITVDHEVGQREISRGVEASIAYARPDAYQLTQALGPRDQNSINPDVVFFEITEDCLFIMVSDGLSDNDVLENHGHNQLLPLLSSGANLQKGVTELIDLANQYNGHDNITAILIRAKVRPDMDS